jgi:hypothetical protein
MPNRPTSLQDQAGGGKAAIYVCLNKGEPYSSLSEQIQSCLQTAEVQQQSVIEIYGDIQDPQISVEDIPLSYPPYQLTITQIIPHNGEWTGFRLRATRRSEEAT